MFLSSPLPHPPTLSSPPSSHPLLSPTSLLLPPSPPLTSPYPPPFLPTLSSLMCGAQSDPELKDHRRKLIISAAKDLDKARMIRFAERTGTFHATDLGRTASNYYIKHNSIEVSSDLLWGRALAVVICECLHGWQYYVVRV